MKAGLLGTMMTAVALALGTSHAGRAGKPEAAGEAPSLRRFALVVGANDGGTSRVRLRYAGTDAVNFTSVMTRFGGVAEGDVWLLQEPSRKQFLTAMEGMKARVAEAQAAGIRAELLVYYSGHSDENGLMLGGERLAYPEFRSRIDAVPARIRVAVVDACASGALTRLKGGSRLPAFSVDQSSNLSGYAFLTSSSGAEAAQESDRIKASYFTHYLVSGLRGAADRNQDGRVTLGEAYAFAFQETLSQTEGSQAGAQHPSYDMRLTGTGDLVLTDLRGTSAGLVLAPPMKGRLFVRSSKGDLVAELQKQPGAKVELGLEPGLYDLRLDQGDSLFQALVKVDATVHAPVSRADFAPAARERTRSRGGDPDSALARSIAETTSKAAHAALIPSDDGWIPARAAVVPGVGFPGRGAGPWSHNLSVNLFAGRARAIHGLQFSLGANHADGGVDGMQFGLLNFSDAGSRGLQLGMLANARARGGHTGAQLALLANNADTLTGLQMAFINHAGSGTGLQAGLLNTSGTGRGVQAGLINAARGQSGVQAGLVNAAGTQTGVQVGLINAADTARGLQMGLVNYARHSDGAVLGLFSLILNGLHDVEATFDDRSMLRTALVLGGPYNYNYISFDMKAREPRHLWGASAGVGVHIPYNRFFADIDAGVGSVFNEVDWENHSLVGRVRAIGGISPARYFNLFGGFTYNVEAWPGSKRPNLNPGIAGDRMGDDIRTHQWPGFVLGVRI